MAPSVVVLHEVFGVKRRHAPDLRRPRRPGLHRRLSGPVLAPEPGVDLSVTSATDWNRGLALYTAYDREAGVTDVIETLKAAAGLEGASGKVAVMGYCLGGLMTFLTAARSKVDAACAYHGGDTDKYLDRAAGITAPFLLHLADEDEFIPKAAQDAIKAALAGKRTSRSTPTPAATTPSPGTAARTTTPRPRPCPTRGPGRS